MTQLALIRQAIVGVMQSVADIGRVHPFERNAARAADFQQLYQAEIGGVKQIRGWHVRRVAETRTRSVDRGDKTIRWRIRGFLSLNDAAESELVFDALVDAVMAAFEADETLGGVVDTILDDQDQSIVLEKSEPVLLAGVLCHSAALLLVTRSTYF